MSFTVTIEGLDELIRAANEGDRALSDGVRQGVADAVKEGAQEARDRHRYQDRTGTLTGSIDGRVEVSTPGGATGVIEAVAPYASFVDGGTAPHVILPKNANALVFQVKNGDWVVTKRVQHPGTKPDGFMGNAYLKAERVLIREVEVAIAKAKKIVEE